LGLAACVLAAADAYQGRLELRPHRDRYAPELAARELLAAAAAGALDRRAVEGVLAAAGHAPSPGRAAWPAGLTDREVEVLRHVARGQTNKQVAAALGISSRTVQHHTLHIYGKLGISTRAAAALFAVEQGLLEQNGPTG
jgi:DNA-binding NarL/FixJ family response regulator